jgi:hypothetical protein
MPSCYVPNRNADGLRCAVLLLGKPGVDPNLHLVEVQALCQAIASMASEMEESTIATVAHVAARMAAELVALTDVRLATNQARQFRKLAQQIAATERASA